MPSRRTTKTRPIFSPYTVGTALLIFSSPIISSCSILPEAKTVSIPQKYSGKELPTAVQSAQIAGYETIAHSIDTDYGDVDTEPGSEEMTGWTVCFQKATSSSGSTDPEDVTIELDVIMKGIPCPISPESSIAYHRIPRIKGMKYTDAALLIYKETSVVDTPAASAYSDVTLPSDVGDWKACSTDDGEGEEVTNPNFEVNVEVVPPSAKCPKKESYGEGGSVYLYKDDDDTGSEESATYYANCTAVREAGDAPLYADDPGYREGLDRDGDGVACEPWGRQ
ncbi:excalibur calcium-binding domain-containing protein [Streptomyces sp. NPDC127077]|uniref:excalibur calcium-binding domain-containing protein n=1 Tax=Streptomyces sp. NPDC127077 TaxID=3347131 RepID=UPI00365B729F